MDKGLYQKPQILVEIVFTQEMICASDVPTNINDWTEERW